MALFLCALTLVSPTHSSVQAQQPTGSIPTVTGTASGAVVAVDLSIPYVSVYSGPSTYFYPAIGVLIAGQEVPALGYSEDQNWLQIYYPGVTDSVAWVYGPFVKIVKSGSLPILAAPSTPTPASTPTINPTLVAAFIIPVTPTRLVTFTVPAPLVLPSFEEQTEASGLPVGLLIFGLGFIGGLGVLISFLRGR
ncbi:MAG: hypothetical protein JNM55_12980 [Anaerolineales bacterium]|nr:hypothetical protein [Anaerolineales bacterium]